MTCARASRSRPLKKKKTPEQKKTIINVAQQASEKKKNKKMYFQIRAGKEFNRCWESLTCSKAYVESATCTRAKKKQKQEGDKKQEPDLF